MGAEVEETVLDGMPSRLFAATPTRLTTWADCPRRYRFTYLDRREKGRPWAHNSVGAAAHNALRDWWFEPTESRTSDFAAGLVRDRWLDDGFRDDTQSHTWRERTADAVAAYVQDLDGSREPVGVERTVGATTPRLALSGRIDRIDRRDSVDGGEELVVVDYKTGLRAPGADDARSSLALAVYVAAVRRSLRGRCRRVELHHLPTGSVAAHDHSEESLARHLGRADDIGREAQAATQRWRSGLSELAQDAAAGVAPAIEAIDAVFPPRPSPGCAWCDFREHCPDGRAVSDELTPWAALAQD